MAKKHPKSTLEPQGATITAAVLGLSMRHFYTLARNGTIPRAAKGRYDLPAAVQSFIRYLKAGGAGGGALAAERVKLARAQREAIEQRTRVRAGELLPRGEVSSAFVGAQANVASQLEALPGRHAMQLAAITDPALIRQILLVEVRRVRASAADELEAFADSAAGSRRPAAAAHSDGRHVGG